MVQWLACLSRVSLVAGSILEEEGIDVLRGQGEQEKLPSSPGWSVCAFGVLGPVDCTFIRAQKSSPIGGKYKSWQVSHGGGASPTIKNRTDRNRRGSRPHQGMRASGLVQVKAK